MDLQSLLPLVMQICLALIVASIGLQSRWSDLPYILHHPGLLVRGILCVNVVVPGVAVFMVAILPVEPLVEVGLVLMAVSPLAPFAPGKMFKAGCDAPYVVSLYVALILLAALVVPVTAALLSEAFPVDVTVPVWIVAVFVAKTVLLPLAVGLTVGSLWPGLSRQLAPLANGIGNLGILPMLAIILFTAGGQALSLLHEGVFWVILAAAGAGLAAGHWLGGPVPEHRVALAQAAATRHPGIAGLIAQRHFDDPRVMLAILLFLLVSIILCALYQTWVTRRLHDAAPTDSSRAPS